LIVSLASTEFKDEIGVNECTNTDNISDVHCKFKRLGGVGARLTSTHPWRPGMWPASQRRRVAFCPCF